MTTVRCKVMCQSIKTVDWQNPETKEENRLYDIGFSFVYSDDPKSENRTFWEATPSGNLQFFTVNANAAKQFAPMKQYYLDLMPSPDQPHICPKDEAVLVYSRFDNSRQPNLQGIVKCPVCATEFVKETKNGYPTGNLFEITKT